MANDITPLAMELRARATHMVTLHGKQHVMWVPGRAGAQLRGRDVEGYVAFTGDGIEVAHTIRWLIYKVRIRAPWGKHGNRF